MSMNTKMTAAVSAVINYLREEEELIALQHTYAVAPESSRQSHGRLNLWGISGRQALMNMRTLMQNKGLHRK